MTLHNLDKMLKGESPLDLNTLDHIYNSNCSTIDFNNLDLSQIDSIPYHIQNSTNFQGLSISTKAFLNLFYNRHKTYFSNCSDRDPICFFHKNKLDSKAFSGFQKKIKIIQVQRIKQDLLNKDAIVFLKPFFKFYKKIRIDVFDLKIENKSNYLFRLSDTSFWGKTTNERYYPISDALVKSMFDEKVFSFKQDHIIVQGQLLNLSNKVLLGKRPVTKDEFLYLIKNHKKYDLTKINTSNITSFYQLFANSDFNQDIGNWDVSGCSEFSHMFSGATHFSHDISRWNVSNGKRFKCMFYNTSFNIDISHWDFRNAKDIYGMFCNATDVNPDFRNINLTISAFSFDHDINMLLDHKIGNPIIPAALIPIFRELENKNYTVCFDSNANNILKSKKLGMIVDEDCLHLTYMENPLISKNIRTILKKGAVLFESVDFEVEESSYVYKKYGFHNATDIEAKKNKKRKSLIHCEYILKVDHLFYTLTQSEYSELKDSGLFDLPD